jgi:hypothetical protein
MPDDALEQRALRASRPVESSCWPLTSGCMLWAADNGMIRAQSECGGSAQNLWLTQLDELLTGFALRAATE